MILREKSMQQEVKAFLSHAQTCYVSQEEFLRIKRENQRISYFGINGLYFIEGAELKNLQDVCIKIIHTKHGRDIITDKEIVSILENNVMVQKVTGQDMSGQVLKSLEELSCKNIHYIASNYAIRLNGVSEFSIGPITCKLTKDLKSKFPEALEDANIVIDQTSQPGGHNELDPLLFPLSEQCFIISMKCSFGAADRFAQTNIEVALSLLRFYLFKHKMTFGHFPYINSLDPLSFQQRERKRKSIIIEGGKNNNGVIFTNHPIYEVNQHVIDALANDDFYNVCDAIFNAPDKTINAPLKKALSWMTKARQSDDWSLRFLFFFTALEALLADEGKQGPVTDILARNIAAIVADVEFREDVFCEIKKLYDIRSKLIHAGANGVVSEAACASLQLYAETVCLKIINTSLNLPNLDFQKKLKKVSFGLEWT